MGFDMTAALDRIDDANMVREYHLNKEIIEWQRTEIKNLRQRLVEANERYRRLGESLTVPLAFYKE